MRLLHQSYELPLREPWTTARAHVPARAGYLVWLVDRDGSWGLGDASPLPGDEATEQPRLSRALDALSAHDSTADLEPHLERIPNAATARALRHGWNQALLDLHARQSDRSLTQELRRLAPTGPTPATTVTVNATLGTKTLPDSVAAAAAAVKAGYSCLKLKIGPAPHEVERVAAVRAAIGPAVRLRLDANASWAPDQAPRLLQRFQELDIEYIEQPFPPGRMQQLADVARDSPIKIAADESAHNLAHALQLAQRKVCPVIIVKPQALGGLDRALEVIQAAHKNGIQAVVTDAVDSAVGRAGAASLAALLGKEAPACGIASGTHLERDVVPAPELPKKGRLAVPHGPGHGVNLPPPTVKS